MKLYVMAALLLIGSSVFAQTANVIELEPSDVVKAKKAYADLQAAQLIWDSTKAYIGRKYIPDGAGGHCTYNIENRCVPDQWSRDFEFSTDFKVIVPKPPEKSPSQYGVVTPWYSSPAGNLQLN